MQRQRRRRSKRIWYVILGVFIAVFLFSFLAQRFKNDSEVDAASTAGFDPGYIISDYQMGNYNSMSEADIQRFLTSKNSCPNTNYNYYLSLSANGKYTWHWANGHFVCLSEERFGDGEVIGSGDTAAHIIWQAAQDYRINPQVLIVLLQKETSLITDPIPNNGDYRKATGYGCPDTAPCSSQYYGFKNQVRKAAALFRTVLDGGWTNYPLGNNYVQYNPNAACGGSVVNIRSLATSALYRYTPYQPNAGALAAGYGTAYCGAYGNRNFYLYFEDWFGGIRKTQSSTKIPNGVYYIKATKNSNMALDVAGGVNKNGTNVQLYSSNNTMAQQWRITYNSVTDDYTVVNVLSGRYLDVDGASIKEGTNVQIWENTNSCAQRWKIIGVGGDDVKLISACSTKALDIVNAETKNGTNIHLWFDNDTMAQKWELMPVNSLDEGGMYNIQFNDDKTKVIDISGGVNRAGNGTNVQLYSNNDTGAQRWRIVRESNGYYVISNPQSGKNLDVLNGAGKNGTNVQIYQANKACAQRWKIMKNDDSSYTFLSACSNKILDLVNGYNRNGTNIQLWEANNSPAQKWALKKIEIVDDGEYEIISALSDNKAMDLAGNRSEDGANIQLYDNNGSSAQRWKITYDINRDYYNIVNVGALKSIDAAGAGTWMGTNVHLWSLNGCCAQKWSIFKDGLDKYVIASGCSDLVVDVMEGNKKNGTNIRLWERNGFNAQKWKLKK